MRSICSFLETITDIVILPWNTESPRIARRGTWGQPLRARGGCPHVPLRAIRGDLNFLEQRRGTSGPTHFAFFFRDLLQFVHICACLREYVMEIVSEAVEHEPFVEKFADAGRSEQENAENEIVLPGGVDQLLCCIIQLRRSVHIGELILFV